MKIAVFLPFALLGLILRPTFAAVPEPTLEQNFAQPPASAKPHTCWHWMNGNITKEGITADLEAMQRVGLGGAQAFHVSNCIPAGPVAHMSAAWREMNKHTITEAGRLGLEICLHNCGDWSASGGPWITPDYAMQKVVFTEKTVQGPAVFTVELPQPKAKENFYRDIAVLDFPTPAGELSGQGFRIADWEAKSGASNKDKLTPDERTVVAEHGPRYQVKHE